MPIQTPEWQEKLLESSTLPHNLTQGHAPLNLVSNAVTITLTYLPIIESMLDKVHTWGQSVSIFSSTFFAVIAMGLLDAIFLVTLDT